MVAAHVMDLLFMIVTALLVIQCPTNKYRNSKMKEILLIITISFFPVLVFSQSAKPFIVSITGGPFEVGKGNIQGVWISAAFEKRLLKRSSMQLSKLAIGPEVFFENGADKATVLNPTTEEFMHQRFFHESNTGLGLKIIFYPFRKWAGGFHISLAPLIVYSIRTEETRAELIQYSPTLAIRMSELKNENRLLGGIRITGGYDFYFAENWLVGVRADFVKFTSRDLNSLLGLKFGYRL
jgi:hypothetical protein